MAEPADTEYVLYHRGEESGSETWDDSALIKAYDEAVSVVKEKLAEQNPDYSPLVSNSKSKKKKKNKGKQKKRHSSVLAWKAGDRCQAVYTEDGAVYEARIMSVCKDTDTCTVQYIGYGNEEEQQLTDLMPAGCFASSQRTDTASETESINQEPFNQREPASDKSKNRKLSKGQGKSKKTHGDPQHFRPWNGEFPAPPLPPAGPMMPPPPPFPPFQPPHFPGYPSAGPSAPTPSPFPSIPPPPPLFTQRGSGDENEAMYSMLMSWYMSGYHTGYYQGLKQAQVSGASAASAHNSHR